MQRHELLELATTSGSARDDLKLALLMIQKGSVSFDDEFLSNLQDAGFINHKNQITSKGQTVIDEVVLSRSPR